MDAGGTGLDLCTRCGGLSRDGHPLPRSRRYRSFDRPTFRDVPLIEAHGVIVQAILFGGAPGIMVAFVMNDGRQLPPFVLTGEPAQAFPALVADAWAGAQLAQN